ncbi:uncharacterized protein [Hemitrygon akajei]|uniref:uncharacterized protein n=1 Tax=Hemitrygon akajei TaxID=2704970 RepID=UPI003BF952D9
MAAQVDTVVMKAYGMLAFMSQGMEFKTSNALASREGDHKAGEPASGDCMLEAKSEGEEKAARRKKQNPSAGEESQLPLLPPTMESSSAAYVIEWLCAQPATGQRGPAEDPPSFHDLYHRVEGLPSCASSTSSCSSSSGEAGEPGPRNGLNSYVQTIRYCSCERPGDCGHSRPEGGGQGQPGITVTVGDRRVDPHPAPGRVVGARRSPGQPPRGRLTGCSRSPEQPACGCVQSPGQPARDSDRTPRQQPPDGPCRSPGQPARENSQAQRQEGHGDAEAAEPVDVTARAGTPGSGTRASPAQGWAVGSVVPERGAGSQDAVVSGQKKTEPRQGVSALGEAVRIPGGAEMPPRLSGPQGSGGQILALGNESLDVGEGLSDEQLCKRHARAGADKETHMSGASVSLEKMSTEEVCRWRTDSGFQSCVHHDIGSTDIDNVFCGVELPTDRPGSEDRISGEHLLQANPSYVILEELVVESTINNSPVDILYSHQTQQLVQDTPSKSVPLSPAASEQDQVPLLNQRVLELSKVVDEGLREAGCQVQECDLWKPLDPALMKDQLGRIQEMMEEVEENILQIELGQQSYSWEDRDLAKASGEDSTLELHLIQQKVVLLQLKQRYCQAKMQLCVNDLQDLLQQAKKPLSPLVPSSAQLLQVEVDMDPRKQWVSLDIDPSGTPMVTSSALPVLAEGDRVAWSVLLSSWCHFCQDTDSLAVGPSRYRLIEINGRSARDCSVESLEQMLGETGTTQILVLRNEERQPGKSAEGACALESALKELTVLQSDFIATSVELSALRNEKGEMWAEIQKLRERESLLLQENKRALHSADMLKQLLERSEYRWIFLKEQLEAMKGAFQLETRKLDTVEARLKEEIDALKQKSCQDDKKIKDLAAALKEKVRPDQDVTSEQLKLVQRQKSLAKVKEGVQLLEQLEDRRQQSETPCEEWPHSPGPQADGQGSRPTSGLAATCSQCLDHRACGDRQVDCQAVPRCQLQGHSAEDNWPCSQGEGHGLQARHPHREPGSLKGHQPHDQEGKVPARQELLLARAVRDPEQEQRAGQDLRREGRRCQSSAESATTPPPSNRTDQGQPAAHLQSERDSHPGRPFDRRQQNPRQGWDAGGGWGQGSHGCRRPSHGHVHPVEERLARGTEARERGRPVPHTCRRARPKESRDHILRLSVRLGEEPAAGPRGGLEEPSARTRHRKRVSHHLAAKRHLCPEHGFVTDSLNTKLHKEQRAAFVLTSQDLSKETTAKKKQLAQLLQMVANHTSHLLKGNMLENS